MLHISNCQPRKGTPSQAAGYCKKGERSKPDEGWAEFAVEAEWDGKEFGTRIKNPSQGERTDITAFRESTKRGATDAELLEEHIGCCAKYQKLIAFTRRAYAQRDVVKLPQGTRQGMGLWIWGPTDTCKSTQIPVEVFGKGPNKWWDGYMGEDVVLFDDPKPEWAGSCMGWLKQWVQEKPFEAEIKGGGLRISFFWTVLAQLLERRKY